MVGSQTSPVEVQVSPAGVRWLSMATRRVCGDHSRPGIVDQGTWTGKDKYKCLMYYTSLPNLTLNNSLI